MKKNLLKAEKRGKKKKNCEFGAFPSRGATNGASSVKKGSITRLEQDEKRQQPASNRSSSRQRPTNQVECLERGLQEVDSA